MQSLIPGSLLSDAGIKVENGDEITRCRKKSSLWYTYQLRPVDCEVDFGAAKKPQSS